MKLEEFDLYGSAGQWVEVEDQMAQLSRWDYFRITYNIGASILIYVTDYFDYD